MSLHIASFRYCSRYSSILALVGVAASVAGATACAKESAVREAVRPPKVIPTPAPRGGDDAIALDDRDVLSGTHSGRPWTLARGAATRSFDGEMRLTFTDAPTGDACAPAFFGARRTVMTSVPTKTGTYRNAKVPKDGDVLRTVTFSESFEEFAKAPTNTATSTMALRIDSISPTEIKGTISARFDDAFKVAGTFTVANCLEGAPPPGPLPSPTPSNTALPAALVGVWEERVVDTGIVLVTQFSLTEAGAARLRITADEDVAFEAEFAATVPSDLPESGLDLKVTRVVLDSEGTTKVGDILQCLRASTTTENTPILKLDCGEEGSTTRPTTFGGNTLTLQRI